MLDQIIQTFEQVPLFFYATV